MSEVILKHDQHNLGRGGGVVVSITAYHYEDSSSIPADCLTFFSICSVRKDKKKKKTKKRPGKVNFLQKYDKHNFNQWLVL